MGLPDIRVCLPTPPGPPGRTLDSFWTSERASQPLPDLTVDLLNIRMGHPTLPDLRLGLQTTARPSGEPPNPTQTTGWAFRTSAWTPYPATTSGWAY